MAHCIYTKNKKNKINKNNNFSIILTKNINNISIFFNYFLKKNIFFKKFNINLINSYIKIKKKTNILIVNNPICKYYIQDKIYNKILFIKKNTFFSNLLLYKYKLSSVYHRYFNDQLNIIKNTIPNLNFSNIYYYYIKNNFFQTIYIYWKNIFSLKTFEYNIFKGFSTTNKKYNYIYSNLLKDITSGLVYIEYIFECKELTNKYLISSEISILINKSISYEENICKYIWFYNIYTFSNKKLIINTEILDSLSNIYENIGSIITPSNIIVSNAYSINNLIFKLFLKNLKSHNQEFSSKLSHLFIFNLLVESLIKQYLKNGIIIPNIQFELIVKKMTSFVKINYIGESSLMQNEVFNFDKIEILNSINNILGYKQILYTPIVLGITKSTLAFSGMLASISFQEIFKYLIKFSIESNTDWLTDFKSKIITTDLIKTGSGWYRHFIKI